MRMVLVELPLIFALHGRSLFIGMDERWMLMFGAIDLLWKLSIDGCD
jgi:hypothetical protein